MDNITREDLKKYSREELENIIISMNHVIVKYNIRETPDSFLFDVDGKCYDAIIITSILKHACEDCDKVKK